MNDNMQENGHGTNSALMGFVVGAAVGAGVALLLAPASGTETRRKLGQTARRIGHQVREGMEHTRDHLGEMGHDVQSAVNAGREAFRHERESHAARTDQPRT